VFIQVKPGLLRWSAILREGSETNAVPSAKALIRRMFGSVYLRAMALATLGLLAPSFTATAAAQSVSLSPSTGAVGTAITLTGAGYPPSQPAAPLPDQITVTFGPATLSLPGCQPDSNGAFSCSFNVPPVSPGAYTVTVSEIFSGITEGSASATFTIPSSELGVGLAFQATTSYPNPVYSQACVTSGGYIYCVGGINYSDGFTTNQSYYAPLTASGVGAWQPTTNVSDPLSGPSCIAAGGNIVCTGGLIGNQSCSTDASGNTTCTAPAPTTVVRWAPLSSTGIGAWHSGYPYSIPAGSLWYADVLADLGQLPGTIFTLVGGVTGQSCATDGGYVYCVGGTDAFSIPILSAGTSNIITDLALSAPIGNGTDTGIPTLTDFTAADYLAGDNAWQYEGHYGGGGVINSSCVIYGGFLYCVGGNAITTNFWDQVLNPFLTPSSSSQVWYAPAAAGIVGPWTQTTSYGGGPVTGHSCTVAAGNIVCVGGVNGNQIGANQVWAAPLSSSGVGNWSLVAAYPSDEGNWVSGSCLSAASPASVVCVGGTNGNPYGVYTGIGSSASAGISSEVNFAAVSANIELQDSSSCAEVGGGSWDSSSSNCTISSNYTVPPGLTLKIDVGVTLTVGDPADICSNVMDCSSSLAITNNGFIDNFGDFVNYGVFTNSRIGNIANEAGGTITNEGQFTNAGTITSDIGSAPGTNLPVGQIINLTTGIFTTSGLIAEGSVANTGSVTIVLNSNTCQNAPANFSVYSRLVIFGAWNSTTPSPTCTVGYNPLLVGYTVLDQILAIPQGYTWQVPAGVTLLNQGVLEVHGTIQNSGSLTNQGFFNNNGSSYLANTGFLYVDGSIANSGLLTNQNIANLIVLSGGVLTNPASAEINDLNYSSIYVNPGGTLTSCGTITVDSSSGISDLGIINNCGTIFNSGSITTTLDLLAVINNQNGGTIVNQNGGTTNGAGGTLTGTIGSTTVTLNASSCASLGGSWTAASSDCVIGPATTASVNYGQTLQIGPGVTLENFGEVDVYGAINVLGTILNHTHATIMIGLGDGLGFVTVGSSGTIFNYNFIFIAQEGASLTNAGSIVNVGAGGGSSLVNQGLLSNSGAITNYGDIENRDSVQNTGTITDKCSGTFDQTGTFSGNTVVAGTCTPAPLEPTTITLTSAPNPLSPGQSVTLTAAVWPGGEAGATGTVTFYDGTTVMGTSSLTMGDLPPFGTVAGNQATFSAALAAGVQSLTAQYNGDTSHAPSTSAPVLETVLEATTVTLAASPNPSSVGQSVTLTATVSPATATGTVTFYNGSTSLGQSTVTLGSATFTSSFTAGVLSLTAQYNGDASNAPSTSNPPVGQTVVGGSPYNNPVSVATADFNGDGKLDLAVVSENSNIVSVLLGNGDGTFQLKADYSVGSRPVFVAVGDFNGDGRLDLAVANSEGGDVSVLLGNGDGTFQTAVNYGTGDSAGPVSLAVGDFSGNGRLDLAVTNEGSGNLSVLLGNGDGTFGTGVHYSAGAAPSSVAVGDFNGDGKLDLAVTNESSGNLSVLLGNGDGTFQGPVNYSVGGGQFSDPVSVAVGDFRGNGLLDLAVAKETTFSGVSVLLGNGDGTFQPETNYNVAGIAPLFVAVGDFNGDGKLDLVVASVSTPPSDQNATSVSILLGNGDGTFQAPASFATGTSPTSIAVGDFTGNGVDDFVTANAGSNNLTVVLGVSSSAAPTTLTVTAASGSYGGSTGAITATLTQTSGGSGVSGQTINFTLNGVSVGTAGPTNSSGVATLSGASLTSPSKISAGTYGTGVGASFAGNSSFSAGSATNSLTVSQKSVTPAITASNKTYDGTTTVTITSCTVSPVVGTDDVACSVGSASFLSKNASAGISVIGSGISPTGTTAANYSLSSTTAGTTANIAARSLTVTATGVNKTYDGTTAAAVTLADNRVSGDVFTDSYTTASFAQANVGNGIAVSVSGISISGTDAGNYTFNTTAIGSGNINPALASVTPIASSKIYGTTDPAFTGTLTGFLLADGVTATYSRTAGETVLGSPYTISATLSPAAVLSNYTITYSTAPFVILQAPVLITLSNLTQNYSGVAEPVTVATSPNGVAIVSSYTGINGTVYGPLAGAPTNPGSYTVVETVTDPNYVGQQSGTLTINQLDPALNLTLMAGMPATTPYGTTVYFTLGMASTPQCPTGSVQFFVDGNASGAPVALSGVSCSQPVPFQIATMTPGAHSVSTVYTGDAYFIAETSAPLSYSVTADATSVTLAASASTVNVGQPLTLTATLTPASPDNGLPDVLNQFAC
jgi:hypothetical protein